MRVKLRRANSSATCGAGRAPIAARFCRPTRWTSITESQRKEGRAGRGQSAPQVTNGTSCGDREVRRRLRQLPRDSDIRSDARPEGAPFPGRVDSRYVALHRHEEKTLASECGVPQRSERRAVPRLQPTLPVIRDAVRSPRWQHQAMRCVAIDPPQPQAHPRGSREVRYRLCELPPRADIPPS